MTQKPTLPAPLRLLEFPSLDSTSNEARRQAELGAEDGLVVWALEQTDGRGRRGRTWVSAPGNLYFSLLLRPGCSPARAAEFTFLACDALARTVVDLLPSAEVACKWPNDVLVNGRKVAGILIESQAASAEALDFTVVGVGINVHVCPDDDEVQFPATSLNAEGATEISVAGVLETFCRQFQHLRKRWERQGFEPVREAWLKRAFRLGAPVRVALPDRTVEGLFRDLGEDGALILEVDGRTERILAGDVFPVS